MKRREFLRVSTAGVAGTWAAAVPGRAYAQGRGIKIGYVSPQTGPLAGFGEADTFVVGGVRKALGKGLTIRDRVHPVEILVRDSQSDPNRAAVGEGAAGAGRAEDGGSAEGVPGGGSLVLRLIAHPDRKEIGKTFTFTSGED